MPTAPAARVRSPSPSYLDSWPLLAGFAVLAIPTAITLAELDWTRENGAHEPIVLAVSCWLFWRQWPQARSAAVLGHWAPTLLLLLIALPTYVFGRAYDFPTLEAAGLFGAGLALLHARFGLAVIRALWFPILFTAFAIPPPQALLDTLTAPLKELVSYLATSSLALLGLPVARQGVVIFVAQYQLLVEDACSGMNSLVGLTALSLLYGFLSQGQSLANSAFMIILAIPAAIAANVARVALLVLVTYVFGDAAAQGFMHFAAGIVLFSIALLLIFATDKAVRGVASLNRRA
jgi:exosortase